MKKCITIIRMNKVKSELTKQDIEHLAKLSQLQLTDKELEKIGAQLNETLEFVANLLELSTSDKISTTPKHENVWRDDEIDMDPVLTQEQALSNAKNTKDGYFVVGKVL